MFAKDFFIEKSTQSSRDNVHLVQESVPLSHSSALLINYELSKLFKQNSGNGIFNLFPVQPHRVDLVDEGESPELVGDVAQLLQGAERKKRGGGGNIFIMPQKKGTLNYL